MKKGNLKKSINQYVEEQSLSDEQLEDLYQLQQNIGDTQKKNTLLDTTLAGRIGSEVAKNHIKLKPLEIQTASIQAIREYFTELDFSPIESSLLQASGKTLLGARYCSIQGVTAAQLRLKDTKTGQVQSLYQTIYKPEVFTGLPELEEGKQPITVYDKGLEVDIWVEKGLLFALTKQATN